MPSLAPCGTPHASEDNQAAAASKGGTTEPHKVTGTLKSSGPWESVVGPVAFDHKGDRTAADYVMYRWDAGHYGQVQ